MLPGGQCRLDRFGFGCLSTVKNPIVHPLPVFGPKGPPPVKRGVGRPKKPHEPQSDAVVDALAIHKKKKQEKAAAQEVAARLKSDKTRYIAMKLTVIDRVTKFPTLSSHGVMYPVHILLWSHMSKSTSKFWCHISLLTSHGHRSTSAKPCSCMSWKITAQSWQLVMLCNSIQTIFLAEQLSPGWKAAYVLGSRLMQMRISLKNPRSGAGNIHCQRTL